MLTDFLYRFLTEPDTFKTELQLRMQYRQVEKTYTSEHQSAKSICVY